MSARLAVLLACLLPQVLTAQSGAVRGVVTDSIQKRPLANATVQLVPEGAGAVRAATSDSTGRFEFTGLKDGRYLLGFQHPLLDSLGIEAPARSITVLGVRPLRADLAIPSPTAIRRAICSAHGEPDDGGLLMGVVRSAATGDAVDSAAVQAEWIEMTIGAGNLRSQRERLSVPTARGGFYALCNIPAGGMLLLRATHAAEDTDPIEISVPTYGFARRDLYLGAEVKLPAADTTPSKDSVVALSRIRRGDGRVDGRVRIALQEHPISNAIVQLGGGTANRTDDAGAFHMLNVPTGTRQFEARAVGYLPQHFVVDIRADASPLDIEMMSLRSLLDTVKIVVAKPQSDGLAGFDRRRRARGGTFLDAKDIARRGATELGDLFRLMNGVRLQRDLVGDERILVRGMWGYCEPAIYLDGLFLFSMSRDELDAMAPLKRVKAIEVYDDVNAPAEFRQLYNACGAVVIWTR